MIRYFWYFVEKKLALWDGNAKATKTALCDRTKITFFLFQSPIFSNQTQKRGGTPFGTGLHLFDY
jgi:hypothetical protein